jgi:hypothetical protein
MIFTANVRVAVAVLAITSRRGYGAVFARFATVLCGVALAFIHHAPVQAVECVGFPTVVSYPGGTKPRAVSVADFNADGQPDIFAATSNGALVMLGNGDGTFGAGVIYGSAATGVAAGDVNGDGRLDLALASSTSQAAVVLLGAGDGTFSAPASFSSSIASTAIAVGDVDKDGKQDLVLVGGEGTPIGNRNLSILRGLGNGTFGAPVTGNAGTHPSALILADFNGDSYPDIATATFPHLTHVAIVLNHGDGTFGPQQHAYNPFNRLIGIQSITSADFNNDGKIDIGFTSPTGVLIGNGDGTFTFDGSGYVGGLAVAAGDMNGDGMADVVLGNGANEVQVFLGNGDGTLGPSTAVNISAKAWYLALADFNADGRLDVATANMEANTISVLLNAVGACPPPFPSAPVITSQPSSQILRAGEVVTWTASASGVPAPAVQWQYSTNSGATWHDIAGGQSTTYSFVASVGDSARQFRAVFTNSNGTAATTPAGLTVTSDRPFAGDVDGDGRSDLIVWRPNNGTWYALTSGSGFDPAASLGVQWGSQAQGDVPLLADMDGDRRDDFVAWRASTGTWYWLRSSSNYNPAVTGSKQWGNAALGDIPLTGDVDGDGKGDLIVWRASTGTWYWLTSSSGYDTAAASSKQWGNNALGDVPILGDLDGDGKADLTVWRSSTGAWYWLTSSSGYSASNGVQWGSAAYLDARFLRDVDDDGRADLIVWRPGNGTWYWLTSSSGYSYAGQGSRQWGAQGDTPLVGDLDGDGVADFAVWRPDSGTWFWLTSSTGFDYAQAGSRQWGSGMSGASAPLVPLIK